MSIRLNNSEKEFYILFLNLLASVLKGSEPPALPENFNWRRACRFAQRNSVANIIAYCFDKVNVRPDETVYNVMENDRRYHILKETSQLFDVEKILREFDEAGVRNVPLKGYFMKHIYPQTDFRTMTDIDILVDKKNFGEVERIFTEQGFENVGVLNVKEIHFRKDLMYFEIHADLNEGDDRSYSDIWNRVLPREGYKLSCKMSDEDFYIYNLYHSFKHFLHGGIGLRMVMDVYVYLTAFPSLDADYIAAELEKRGMVQFEKEMRELAFSWFSDDETVINEFGEFVLYCGTFGDRKVTFYQGKQRTGRFYWLKQVFTPLNEMKRRYSYLDKAPFLLPFSWVQYWFTRIFLHRDLNFKEGLHDRAVNLEGEDAEFVDKLMENLKVK